jgi:hypothetical protein
MRSKLMTQAAPLPGEKAAFSGQNPKFLVFALIIQNDY